MISPTAIAPSFKPTLHSFQSVPASPREATPAPVDALVVPKFTLPVGSQPRPTLLTVKPEITKGDISSEGNATSECEDGEQQASGYAHRKKHVSTVI